MVAAFKMEPRRSQEFEWIMTRDTSFSRHMDTWLTTFQGAGNTWRENELSLSLDFVASFGTRAHCT